MVRFTLPKAGEFNFKENYCENLRSATIAGGEGLTVVGRPKTVLNAAAHVAVLPDGRIISVGSNHRTISIDGNTAGVLGADFRGAMADGEQIAVFTDNGVQWLAGTTLQPAREANINVGLSVSSTVVELSATIDIAPKLKGSYPRLSGPLLGADCEAFAAAFGRTMNELSARAALRGMLTQPAHIGWRMLDAEGHTVAEGAPQRFGSLQGSEAVSFSAVKDGSTFTLTGTGAMRVNAWTVRLRVGRAESEFWRRRARVLELIVYGECAAVAGASGHFSETSGSGATLSVTPSIVETQPRQGVIAARFDLPLEGLDTTVFITDLGPYDAAGEALGTDFIPTEICYGGTLRLYALSGQPGIIGVARAEEPLALRLRKRICEGKILRISMAAGNSGGWNYGRHHFLAFTTAGIYAVSINSALSVLSSSPVSPESIARADAVAIGAEAVYCATTGGKLLKFVGARVEEIPFPAAAVALGRSASFSELWITDKDGQTFAMDRRGSLSARTVVAISEFLEHGYALTSDGRTVNLNAEDSVGATVCLRRREIDSSRKTLRREQFVIDSANAVNLKIAISADGGGSPRSLVELKVNGPVNAPLPVVYRAPLRAFKTVEISGRLAAGSRLAGRKC